MAGREKIRRVVRMSGLIEYERLNNVTRGYDADECEMLMPNTDAKYR